jgi:hypothetical protein
VYKGKSAKTGKEAPREEPAYVRTTPYDGGKYIVADEFFKDKEIQEQLGSFEKSEEVNGSQQGHSDK